MVATTDLSHRCKAEVPVLLIIAVANSLLSYGALIVETRLLLAAATLLVAAAA